MAVGTTNFPGALDTATELIRAVNAAASTIGAGGVDASATTVPVTSAASAPTDGVAWCENEAISYTGKTATTLTGCVRGFDGTTAAAHAAGVVIVFDPIGARSHNVQSEAIVAVETKLGSGADTPTAGDFFKGTGAGTSGWSPLQSSEVTTALGFTPATNVHSHNLQDLGGAVTDAQVPDTITLANITQITTRPHASLTGIGTNDHAAIDAHIAAANPHSGSQPLDGELTALAGLTSAADRVPYFTGSGAAAITPFTAFARTLMDDADQAAMRTTLGLTPGTDVQAFDADLTDIAGIADVQGDIIVRGASGWQRLAAGTSGHFLKTLGAGTTPAWDAAGGGGGFGPEEDDLVGDLPILEVRSESDITTDNGIVRFRRVDADGTSALPADAEIGEVVWEVRNTAGGWSPAAVIKATSIGAAGASGAATELFASVRNASGDEVSQFALNGDSGEVAFTADGNLSFESNSGSVTAIAGGSCFFLGSPVIFENGGDTFVLQDGAGNDATLSIAGLVGSRAFAFPDGAGTFGIRVAVPATATSAGVPGMWASDATHAYFCHATNTWRRALITTW